MKHPSAPIISIKDYTKSSWAIKISETNSVAVSGGFDPIHIGHIRYLIEAANLGEKLIVIMNGDNFLTKKKGRPFMPASQRAEILASLGVVDLVIDFEPTDPNDMTVSEALKIIQPTIFAKGGDRSDLNKIPESDVCEQFGIKIALGIGGTDKPQSSSWLHGDLRPSL